MEDYKLSQIKDMCKKTKDCGKCKFEKYCKELMSGYTLPDKWEIEKEERTCETCKFLRGNKVTCVNCFRIKLDKLVDCWEGK